MVCEIEFCLFSGGGGSGGGGSGGGGGGGVVATAHHWWWRWWYVPKLPMETSDVSCGLAQREMMAGTPMPFEANKKVLCLVCT